MRGLLDFSQSCQFDPRWRIKRELVFEQLQQENLVKIKTLRHAQHAAASGTDNYETYKHHFETGVAELKGIVHLLFPWLPREGEKAEEYTKAWESFFGIKVGSSEWKLLEDKIKLVDAAIRVGKE